MILGLGFVGFFGKDIVPKIQRTNILKWVMKFKAAETMKGA
jgi:hypothetical protein